LEPPPFEGTPETALRVMDTLAERGDRSSELVR
jgi:hypothetical protein